MCLGPHRGSGRGLPCIDGKNRTTRAGAGRPGGMGSRRVPSQAHSNPAVLGGRREAWLSGMRWAPFLGPLGVLTCCVGCQGPLASGMQAYREARYAQAAEQLEAVTENELAPHERASWKLHLGLSQLALGNARQAVIQLAGVRALLQERPAALSVEERGKLLTAWRSLGSMPGEPLYLP